MKEHEALHTPEASHVRHQAECLFRWGCSSLFNSGWVAHLAAAAVLGSWVHYIQWAHFCLWVSCAADICHQSLAVLSLVLSLVQLTPTEQHAA